MAVKRKSFFGSGRSVRKEIFAGLAIVLIILVMIFGYAGITGNSVEGAVGNFFIGLGVWFKGFEIILLGGDTSCSDVGGSCVVLPEGADCMDVGGKDGSGMRYPSGDGECSGWVGTVCCVALDDKSGCDFAGGSCKDGCGEGEEEFSSDNLWCKVRFGNDFCCVPASGDGGGGGGGGGGDEPVEVKPKYKVQCKDADVNSDGYVNEIDMSLVKMKDGCNVSKLECIKYDVNLDGRVDLTDMSAVKSLIGCESENDISQGRGFDFDSEELCKKADVNSDGSVDLTDMSLVNSKIGCDVLKDAVCAKCDVDGDRVVTLGDALLVKSLDGCSLKFGGIGGSGGGIGGSGGGESVGGIIEGETEEYTRDFSVGGERTFKASEREELGVKQINVQLVDVKKEDLELKKSGKAGLTIQVGEEILTGEIDENGLAKIGNYEVGVGSVKDKTKVEISVLPSEVFEETVRAVFGIGDGRVCFDFSGVVSSEEEVDGRWVVEGDADVVDDKVEVKFDDVVKEFEVKEGENLFIVVKKERGGERYVASN